MNDYIPSTLILYKPIQRLSQRFILFNLLFFILSHFFEITNSLKLPTSVNVIIFTVFSSLFWILLPHMPPILLSLTFSNSLSFFFLIPSHPLQELPSHGWSSNWPHSPGLHLLYRLKIYAEYYSLHPKSVINLLFIPKNEILLLDSLSC